MPTNELTDEVVVGGTPGTPTTPATPGKPVELKALSENEYVAGSAPSWYLNMPRALPWSADDVQHEFGADVYARMMLDAQCKSVVSVFKAAVLEDGIQLRPAVDDKDKPGYKKAVRFVEDAEHMLENMEGSFDDKLWDMLDAVAVGNRMAEQTYDLDTTPSGQKKYQLSHLAVRPMESTAFVVDVYLNVLGIMARIPGQPMSVQQGLLLTDLEHSNVLPRSKFAILSFRPKNGDPRGTSLLRAAFDPWNAKVQLKREFLKYLTQFASPSLIGYTAEEAAPYAIKNSDGSPLLDAYGNPVMRTPEDDMVAALQQFANGTATALPFGARVQPIEMTGDGKPFLDAFDFLDRQITKAVLQQTLATEEGQHQTRASSATHKDLLDTITRQTKRPVERMIRRDILRVWMQLNGSDVELTPKVTLGTVQTEDLARLWTAMANLNGSDFLHESQLMALDEMLRLPVRTEATTMIPAKELVSVKEDGGSVEPVGAKAAPQRDEQGDGNDIGADQAASQGQA
jgi:hypothetical protein